MTKGFSKIVVSSLISENLVTPWKVSNRRVTVLRISFYFFFNIITLITPYLLRIVYFYNNINNRNKKKIQTINKTLNNFNFN